MTTEIAQANGRLRRWSAVPEAGGKFLRVVLLADGETVHRRLFRSRVQAMKIRYFTDTDTLRRAALRNEQETQAKARFIAEVGPPAFCGTTWST